MKSLALCVLALLASLSQAAEILEIQIKTGEEENADLDAGTVGILISAISGTVIIGCNVPSLENGDDAYERGTIDVFHGEQIGECENFDLPDNQIGQLQLTHSGTDNWFSEWVRIILDNGMYIQCKTGEWLEGAVIHEFPCDPDLRRVEKGM